MADLYGTGQSPAAAGSQEEISTFLHLLLHGNTPSSTSPKFMHLPLSSPPPPPSQQPAAEAASATADRHQFGFSEEECRPDGVNYSDPGGYFGKEKLESAGPSVVSKPTGGVSSENELGDFSCDSEKGAEVSEVPIDTVRHRSSSKRSRTAEIHNLSEKRRRSRINEKMKALQNLIPNSNKTDKASMLDEAIEYLKQLQLQVQMLTMRNGLSLHPMCLPGALQPMQLPMTGLSFEEGNGLLNTNRVASSFPTNEEGLVQTALNLPNQCTVSNEAIVVPSVPNISASGSSFGFEPVFPVPYGTLNLSTSSKEICREGIPQAQLDTSQSMKTS